MSRGTIILIVLLCAVLAGLLALQNMRKASTQGANTASAPAPVAVPEPVTTATTPPPVVPRTNPVTFRPLVSPGGTNPSIIRSVDDTNALPEIEHRPLPVLEREYLATTNIETRLDLMMDISETPSADAVKTLTRLFDSETSAEMKVNLIDSLLGIEGFKDEKLIMLTFGIRSGLPSEVRQSAIDGLIDLEDTRAISLLNGLLNDPDQEIREAAQDAIEIIQSPPAQTPKTK